MSDDSESMIFKREWVEQDDGSFVPSDTEIDAVPIAELQALVDEWRYERELPAGQANKIDVAESYEECADKLEELIDKHQGESDA